MGTVDMKTTPRGLLIAHFRATAIMHDQTAQTSEGREQEWSAAYHKMLTACANWLEQEGDLRQAPTEERK